MKNLFLIIIFIVCYGTGKAQGTPIIKLYYVNLNIMTPMDINCDAFKLLFKYEIKKVIIPVAGLGTRFLPMSKVLSKEFFPLADKPIIQYIVEEVKKLTDNMGYLILLSTTLLLQMP